jgi:MFS transporter, DHA1 family, tetracycline resistance protein
MKKPSLLIIFLTVFIDLIGFGIVLPLLPLFAKSFNASGFTIGLLMASFSAMQFIFAPIWGRYSDRIGRRPVLLISTAGGAIAYAIFAIGSGMTGTAALVVLFASRMFAGICGANITVAQAYIADITPPQDRSKRMGLIGMAFGLGFIFGPFLGGLALSYFGPTGPGWLAAIFCGANFLFATIRLRESYTPGSHTVAPRPRLGQWAHTLSQPKIGLLVGLFFLATFCFASFETTLGLLVSKNFNIDPMRKPDAKVVGYLFAYCGIIGALVQGGLIGRMVKLFGEPLLITISLVVLAFGLAPMPFLHGHVPVGKEWLQNTGGIWLLFLGVLALVSIGSSLTRPPLFGMISILTPPTEQGATLGVAQGAGSLARIFGPIFAGIFFEQHPAVPYVVCAVLAFVTGLLAWQFLHKAKPAEPVRGS